MNANQVLIDSLREKLRNVRSAKRMLLRNYGDSSLWYSNMLGAMDLHIRDLEDALKMLNA